MSGFSMNKDYTELPPAEGRQLAFISQIEPTQSRKLDPMLVLRFTMMTGEDDGKSVKEWIVLVDQDWGYGKLKRLVLAIDSKTRGIADDPDGLDDPDDRFDPHNPESVKTHLLGKPVAIIIKHETYTADSDDGPEERLTGRVKKFMALRSEECDQLESVYGEGFLTPELPEDAMDGFSGNTPF